MKKLILLLFLAFTFIPCQSQRSIRVDNLFLKGVKNAKCLGTDYLDRIVESECNSDSNLNYTANPDNGVLQVGSKTVTIPVADETNSGLIPFNFYENKELKVSLTKLNDATPVHGNYTSYANYTRLGGFVYFYISISANTDLDKFFDCIYVEGLPRIKQKVIGYSNQVTPHFITDFSELFIQNGGKSRVKSNLISSIIEVPRTKNSKIVFTENFSKLVRTNLFVKSNNRIIISGCYNTDYKF